MMKINVNINLNDLEKLSPKKRMEYFKSEEFLIKRVKERYNGSTIYNKQKVTSCFELIYVTFLQLNYTEDFFYYFFCPYKRRMNYNYGTTFNNKRLKCRSKFGALITDTVRKSDYNMETYIRDSRMPIDIQDNLNKILAKYINDDLYDDKRDILPLDLRHIQIICTEELTKIAQRTEMREMLLKNNININNVKDFYSSFFSDTLSQQKNKINELRKIYNCKKVKYIEKVPNPDYFRIAKKFKKFGFTRTESELKDIANYHNSARNIIDALKQAEKTYNLLTMK